MRKQFVVPVLRDEAALAQLTLGTQVTSGRGGASCGSTCSGGSAG
jgi:hypothetical protein